MGIALEIVISEEERSEELFREYLEYVQEKEKNIYSDKTYTDIRETYRYQVGLEVLNQTFPVTEQLQRDLLNNIGPNNIYSLLGRVTERNTIFEEDIEKLIEMLRNAKKELRQDGDSPQKTEIRIEAGPVALCEFALEHGYGIRLTE